jgi:hypothetical protein
VQELFSLFFREGLLRAPIGLAYRPVRGHEEGGRENNKHENHTKRCGDHETFHKSNPWLLRIACQVRSGPFHSEAFASFMMDVYNSRMNLRAFCIMLLCAVSCASKPENLNPPASPPFRCTLVLGLTVTAEWFEAGFESIVGDDHWEARLRPHTFVEEWADPNHEVWQQPISSPCADRPESPDRVIIFLVDWSLSDAAAWEAPLDHLITTFRQKFPEARRLELQTMIRGPRNKSCGDPRSVVEPFVDRALREAAATRPELVRVGPVIMAPSCDVFESGGPHFTVSGRSDVAIAVARAYASP